MSSSHSIGQRHGQNDQDNNNHQSNHVSCDGNYEKNYDFAESWCRQTISRGHDMMSSLKLFHEEISKASERFGISFEGILSLFRNAHVIHMKRTSHTVKYQTSKHVQHYLNGMSILSIAKKCNYPPSMMARLIVENVAMAPNNAQLPKLSTDTTTNENSTISTNNPQNNNSNQSNNKTTLMGTPAPHRKFITEALRNPEKILGCASTSIVPAYLFSEKKGRGQQHQQLKSNEKDQARHIDNLSQKPGFNEHNPPLSRLALEVREAIDSDPLYGPRHDRERHNIGIEYELFLEQTLRSMDIPFETEAQLRVRGTARTPDILLSCPVGLRIRRREARNSNEGNGIRGRNDTYLDYDIRTTQKKIEQINFYDDDEYEWKVICWIDSKALFGDVETHTNSVLPQVETYVHRFGPGLVLYWFGHAPLSRLGDGHGDVAIVSGSVPDLFLLPTGEFHGLGGRVCVGRDP